MRKAHRVASLVTVFVCTLFNTYIIFYIVGLFILLIGIYIFSPYKIEPRLKVIFYNATM